MSTFDPVVRVEAAWDATPFTDVTAGSWSTVAEFRSGQWGRGGRSSPIDVYGAGSATLQFHDLDRILDPLNTSSSLNGKLVPDVPVRVIANYSSTDYPLWYGYIDDYDTLFHVGLGEVTIPATDGLRVLAGITMPDPFRDTVEGFDPLGWWRFDSMEANSFVDDIDGKILGTWPQQSGTYQRTGQTVVQGLNENSTGAVRFPEFEAVNLELYYQYELASGLGVGADLVPGDGWAFSCWVSVDSTPLVNGFRVFFVIDSGGDYVSLLVVEDTGAFRLSVGNAAVTIDTNENFCDGQPHHVVCVRDGTTIRLYVDGVERVTGSDAGLTGTLGAGTAVQFKIGENSASFPGTMPAWTLDELVFFGQTFTDADVTELFEAYSSLYGGLQQSGERIDALLTLGGIPSGLRAIDTGEVQVGPQSIAGRSLLDVITEVVQTEGAPARFFAARDGNYTFHDAGRFQRETVETTSQVTFTDTTDGVLYEKGIRFRKGFHDVIDRMDVTRAGGLAQTARASTDTLQGRTLTTVHSSDLQARNLAQRIVSLHSTPTTRVDGWSTQPQVDGEAHWAALLSTELGHRVTVDGTPLNTGSTISIDQHIDSISEEVGATYRMHFTGQRIDDNVYFTWGGDGATEGWGQGVWR